MVKRMLLVIALAVGLTVSGVSLAATPTGSRAQVVAFPPLCC
jgi:hypothetical protein